MPDKGVKPGCKTLTRETTYSDFITAGNDTETMNSARDIANTKMIRRQIYQTMEKQARR